MIDKQRDATCLRSSERHAGFGYSMSAERAAETVSNMSGGHVASARCSSCS